MSMVGRVGLVAFALNFTLDAHAFKPSFETGHAGITRDVLEAIRVTSPKNPDIIYEFSEPAIKEIIKANESSDDFWLSRFTSTDFWDPVNHCDAELIQECIEKVNKEGESAIERMTVDDLEPANAREDIGRALHTIQDFYAHSNWTEIEGDVSNIIEKFHNPAAADPDVCVSVTGSTAGKPFLEYERTCKFSDSSDYPTEWGEYMDCGLKKLTTGYFWLVDAEDDSKLGETFAFKCGHGGEGKNAKEEDYDCRLNTDHFARWSGIHKDLQSCPDHASAFAAATAATKAYIKWIESEIKEKAGGKEGSAEQADEAIRALLGVNGGSSIAFVVDTTGSMGGTINGVKRQIEQIITSVTADPDLQPEVYILVEFADPDVTDGFTTTDPAELLTAVEGLSPSGGDDCPEMSQGGILNALKKSSRGGTVYMYTDADAKDASLGTTVTSTARDMDVRLNSIVSGSCSSRKGEGGSIDPLYLAQPEETGGQMYYVENTEDDVAALFSVIEPALKGNLEPIIMVSGDARSSADTYTFPVDATVDNLTIAITLSDEDVNSYDLTDLFDFSIRGPSGTITPGSTSGTDETVLRAGTIVTIEDPEIGEWEIDVSGDGAPYFLSVKGNSSIGIAGFDFVQLSGRSGHEGYFPLPGQPVTSETQTVAAEMTEDAGDVTFSLIDSVGEELKTLDLEQGWAGLTEQYWVGEIDLDEDIFRVQAEGTDDLGNPFVRMVSKNFQGQPLKVEIMDLQSSAVAGQTFDVLFLVTNLGEDATFEFHASDSLGLLSGSYTQALAADETLEVIGRVEVPDDMEEGEISVTMLAERVDDITLRNTAVATVPVYPDADADGISDHEESGFLGTEPDFDGNEDGIADLEQADVASIFAAGRAFYLTISSSVGAFGAQRLSTDAAPEDAMFGAFVLTLPTNSSDIAKVEFHVPSTTGAWAYVVDEWVEPERGTTADATLLVTFEDGGPEDWDEEDGTVTVYLAPTAEPVEYVADDEDTGGPGGDTEPEDGVDDTGDGAASGADDGDKSGCGCASANASPVGWLMILAGLIGGITRRRRH
jgi:MYXO-CTERM domain-containing protein